MPFHDLTIGDAEMARDAVRGMGAAERDGGTWVTPQELHTWVMGQLSVHGPRVFGINSICVVEAMRQ